MYVFGTFPQDLMIINDIVFRNLSYSDLKAKYPPDRFGLKQH